MVNKVQKYGDGLRIDTEQQYIGNEWMDIDTVNVDLTLCNYASGKLSIDNIDPSMGMPGYIMRIGEYGNAEWVDPSQVFTDRDKELREKYPSLEIAWKNVLEAIHEYEVVKKLVKDY